MSIKKDGHKAKKEKLLSRKRRIIFNNDGGDVFKTPEADAETLLAQRTAALANSHVDVISYTTISAGFGLFTHNTGSGELLTAKHMTLHNNIAPALIEQGKDCLEIMAEFAHANDMEIFWSLRMNDTHDGAHREETPHILFPDFKRKHPEYLMGTPEQPPAHGAWSAVDYGHKEIRERAFSFLDEVCRNYDIDGIELDFFRHPVFFKKTAQGLPAGDEDREKMTELMRETAAMADEQGRRRGRPFLIAARAPDDVDYCNTIGLQIEQWMAERLIDIYIPSGYIRLNPWEYSVRLGHKHGVRVYPGLSESRVGGGHHADPLRSSDECYRARAMNAWNSGADGIYIFNLFDPYRRIWSEMGEPEVLKRLDKLYFASVRGVGRVAGGTYPHAHFITLPTVNPDAPLRLRPDERAAIRIWIGEDFAKIPRDARPKLKLHLKTNSDIWQPAAVFNGHALQGGPAEYEIEPLSVRDGINIVEIHNMRDADIEIADVIIAVDFTGKLLSDRSYLERTKNNM